MADIIDATKPLDTALASTLPSYLRTIAGLLNLINTAVIALGTVPTPPVSTRTVTNSYQILVTDLFIFVNAVGGAINITLPDVAALVTPYASYNVWIKKTDASVNTVTIASYTGGRTIDGEANLVLTLENESALIAFDGTNFKHLT